MPDVHGNQTAQPVAGRELFNERQAADFLNLSYRTLQSWRVAGAGPAYRKFGRSVRYSKRDLENFIEKSATQHTSEAAQ